MRRLPWLLALALLAAPALAGPGPDALRLLAPRPGVPLVGRVEVAFVAVGVPDDRVAEAVILLDGREAARLPAPPWRTTIDCGGALSAHSLTVRLRLRGGGTLERTWRFGRPAASLVESRLVATLVAVTDARGRALTGLTADDFVVEDGGRRVTLAQFEEGPVPLALALVIDVSNSMRGKKLAGAKRAAILALGSIRKNDRVAVLAFDDDVRVTCPLTDDFSRARGALEGLAPGGGTALYDALVAAARLLAREAPLARHAVVLLSDGRDEAANGLGPGSRATLDEAIRALHGADAVVFPLGLGRKLDRETVLGGNRTTWEILDLVARSTGGWAQRADRSTRFGRFLRKVLDDLRHRYDLAWEPPPARAGEWRPIVVRVPGRPRARVRAREGYYAR